MEDFTRQVRCFGATGTWLQHEQHSVITSGLSGSTRWNAFTWPRFAWDMPITSSASDIGVRGRFGEIQPTGVRREGERTYIEPQGLVLDAAPNMVGLRVPLTPSLGLVCERWDESGVTRTVDAFVGKGGRVRQTAYCWRRRCEIRRWCRQPPWRARRGRRRGGSRSRSPPRCRASTRPRLHGCGRAWRAPQCRRPDHRCKPAG